MWNEIDVTDEPLYDFDPNSTYIQNPTFFQGLSKEPGTIEPLKDLRVMGKFGDSVTTDHILQQVLLVKIHQQVNIY